MTRRFPPTLFSRSQSWASQPRSDATEDYVEDSEPEREERRLKAKARRVQRKKTPVVIVSQPSDEVIELTDSSSSRSATPAPPLHHTKSKPIVIIDVSDGSESSTHHDPPTDQSRESNGDRVVVDRLGIEISGEGTLDESLPSIRKVLSCPNANHQLSSPIATRSAPAPEDPARLAPAPRTSTDSSEDESDGGEGQLKLGRFAYAPPNPIRRTASKTPSPTERDSQTPEVAPGAPAKAKRLPSHRFTVDFTDAQLSRLLKCVSCELAWTARKTVKEKMKHIQSCAKKNRLNDETVRILLRKELANLPPVASSSKSKLTVGTPTPSAPETLLEETLKEKARKRSGPRLQVQQTVKSVDETRDSILDKARLLLQSTRNGTSVNSTRQQNTVSPAESDSVMPPPTQAFTRSTVAARNNLPDIQPKDTTLTLGPSRLGVSPVQSGIVNAGAAIAAESDVSPLTQVFSKSALESAQADPDPADDMPPATQVFAPSKLTNAAGSTGSVITVDKDDAIDEPISLHDTSEDDFDLGKSSPPRPTIIELSSSSPSSNANCRPPFRTQTSPSAGPVPAAPDMLARSPSRLSPLFPASARTPSPAGDDQYAPAYDDGLDFHVHDGYEYQWNDWYRDQSQWGEYDGGGGGDAILHYDPEAEAGPSTSKVPAPDSRTTRVSPSPSPRMPQLKRRLVAIPEDGEVPIAGPSRLRDGPVPPVTAGKPAAKKRGRPKKVPTDESDAEAATAGSGKDVSQEELGAKLKEAILKDEALHLRILRYEPIHFDVFMQLAADVGVTEKKTRLRGKVRTFLDQKAIHFYGADPSKSRTKRTRHP